MKHQFRDVAQAMLSRRAFVRAGTTATAAALFPVPSATLHTLGSSIGKPGTSTGMKPPEDPAFMIALAKRAVDAATAAGATYAEARVTRQIAQSVTGEMAGEMEVHGLSVRALVGGGWGFTAASEWTDDTAVALGNDAARQATENAKAVPTPIEMAPASPATGSWSSPLKIDPFDVPIEEKMDLFRSMQYTMPYRSFKRELTAGTTVLRPLGTTRDSHILVTSEGTSIAQRFSWVTLPVTATAKIIDPATVTGLPPQIEDVGRVEGAGWEAIRDYDYATDLQKKAEDAYETLTRKKTFAVAPPGRYTIVLGPMAMRQLLNRVVGAAMNLDRITLRAANTVGTSYLGSDPVALLRRYDFGSPLLSVSAVPWLPGTPTHRWDNEGVIPGTVPLITKGLLQDFVTTREQATWLRDGYQKLGQPIQSHGYATFGNWSSEPAVASPALVMTPSVHDTSLMELVGSVSRGYYIASFIVPEEFDAAVGGPVPSVPTDAQGRQLTLSFAPNSANEIVNGRLGAHVGPAAILFNAVELWKSLKAIGGTGSQVAGMVPALFTDLILINPTART